MNKKRAVFTIFLACGLILLLIFSTACGGDNESEDSSQNDGAISRAKKSVLEWQQEEALQFGIYIYDIDEYKQIRQRLLVNEELASAFKEAKREGVMIQIYLRHFIVLTGGVFVDINATDKEIINFLVDSVPTAKAKRAVFEELEKEARQFGLEIRSSEVDEYKKIRQLLLVNEELVSAFKEAKREEVDIKLDNQFTVEDGWVRINVYATDREIIDFLLGK